MSVYMMLVLIGAGTAALTTPLVARLAVTSGLVDAPGGRKVHTRAVPRLGGVAVLVAAAVTLAIVLPMAGPLHSTRAAGEWLAIRSIVAGGLAVFAIGLLDDVRPLGPWIKLVVQTGAALLVMADGLLIERVTVLGMTWSLGWTAWPVTLVWIVGLTNAFNLIDGIDGLAAGIAAIAGATCAVILIARGHAVEAALMLALVGSAIGFLVHNFPPATIFLGDGGSLLFGFVLATTALAGWQKGATALATAVPLFLFALPLADLVAAVARRVAARGDRATRSLNGALADLLTPDRSHIHHRLLALGWSPRRTVLVLYAASLVFSAFALATARI